MLVWWENVLIFVYGENACLLIFSFLNVFFPPSTNNGYWGNDGVFPFGFYEKEDEDEFPLPLLLRIDSRILSPRKILNGGFSLPCF